MGVLLGLRFIFFLIFYIAVFIFTNETIETGYFYSNMFIAFSCLLALVTCFKYDAIKLIFEKAKKYKFIFATIVIIAFLAIINLIYFIVPQFCEIQDWNYLIYMEEENTKEGILSFIFLPEIYRDLSIAKMTLLESIFSFIFIVIAQTREKLEQKANKYENITKYGIIGYIFDRLLKSIFKYKLFIIFFIYILAIPSKYLMVYYSKIICLSILALAIVIFIIKNYLSIRKCIIKSNQKYGKENLIIVASPDSVKFSFIGDFISPLRRFNRFDTKNIGKSLIVDAKTFVFASYDTRRYKLINENQYQNIAYAIFLKLTLYTFLYANYEDKIAEESINEIRKGNNKFIVFPKYSWYYEKASIDDLNKKYIFRYRNKFDIKPIIEVLNLKEDDINIKHMISDELNKINQKQSKNIYITYSLNNILNSFNYIEYFYSLLKICEYIMHYMALKNIINNPQEIIDKKIKIKEGTLGVWRDSINYDKTYDINSKEYMDIINSMIKLRTILEFKTNYDNNYTFQFKKDLCKTIIDIRNNLLGHGVITYDVSERIVKYLLVIAKEFIKIFESVDVTIEEDEEIKHIFTTDIKAICKENEHVYLYNQTNQKDEESKEYLNYETGKRKVTKNVPECIDKIWISAEIESTLGKFM